MIGLRVCCSTDTRCTGIIEDRGMRQILESAGDLETALDILAPLYPPARLDASSYGGPSADLRPNIICN
jgi:hypothetical protein